MLDKIINVIDTKSKEELTITKGLAFIIIAVSFVLGIILGSACAGTKCKKKKCKAGADCFNNDEDEFDAGEYVRSLNLDE